MRKANQSHYFYRKAPVKFGREKLNFGPEIGKSDQLKDLNFSVSKSSRLSMIVKQELHVIDSSVNQSPNIIKLGKF